MTGLFALMLLIQARRATRTAPDGRLVPLAEQDRSAWDRELVAEGHALVRRCLRGGRPGSFQLQAAIQAVHTDAPTSATTDWHQIGALHDHLLALEPNPVVALNRAVAIAYVRGPVEGL